DAAISYADSVGGGKVLIMPGTHYLGSLVQVPWTVDLEGLNRETCIIVCDGAEDYYFQIEELSAPDTGEIYFTNLSFFAASDLCFTNPGSGVSERGNLIFNNCNFLGQQSFFQ